MDTIDPEALANILADDSATDQARYVAGVELLDWVEQNGPLWDAEGSHWTEERIQDVMDDEHLWSIALTFPDEV